MALPKQTRVTILNFQEFQGVASRDHMQDTAQELISVNKIPSFFSHGVDASFSQHVKKCYIPLKWIDVTLIPAFGPLKCYATQLQWIKYKIKRLNKSLFKIKLNTNSVSFQKAVFITALTDLVLKCYHRFYVKKYYFNTVLCPSNMRWHKESKFNSKGENNLFLDQTAFAWLQIASF